MPLQAIPHVATEFESQVRQLGLTRQTYTASVQLRKWCECNKNRFYIPEWLLEEWRISVDAYSFPTRRPEQPSLTSSLHVVAVNSRRAERQRTEGLSGQVAAEKEHRFEDHFANDIGLLRGRRLLSVRRTSDRTRFWIITEADRSYTTFSDRAQGSSLVFLVRQQPDFQVFRVSRRLWTMLGVRALYRFRMLQNVDGEAAGRAEPKFAVGAHSRRRSQTGISQS